MKTSLKLTALIGGVVSATSVSHASGDYGPAIWNPACSGHWYTTGYGHKFHVCHDMEGYYMSTISYFKNCSTSASVHYCVNGKQDTGTDAPAGEITQMVAEANYAWHVCCWNRYCTGTEHEGFASNPAWYTDALYEASGPLSRHEAQKFGFVIDRNHIVGHNAWQNSAWHSWAAGAFGINTSCNTHTDPGPYWAWSHYMSLVTYVLQGAIQAHYNALGGMNSGLGDPTTSESTTPDGVGRYNHFTFPASIYWTPNYGAWSIKGAIRDKWSSLGWETSFLGYPVTDENTTPDGVGRYNHFQTLSQGAPDGSIYWTPNYGAWSIHGAIRSKWSSLGWEAGVLGYPVTDETGTPDGVGRYNHFRTLGASAANGSIYFTVATGAHEVHGAIRDKWSSLGWETSCLGYPTSDQYASGSGVRNDFQNGYITYDSVNGAVATCNASGPPAAPSGLSATSAGTSQINLSWTDNSNNENNFVVSRSGTTGGPYTDIATLPANTTSYSDTGLAMGVTYYYVVHAVNSSGSSGNSSEASAATKVDVTVDNSDAGFTASASWSTGTSSTDKFGADYRFRSTAATSDPATWTVSLANTGSYTVWARWAQGSNRSASAPYIVYTSTGSTTVNVNQQVNGGTWVSLGTFNMNVGSNKVSLSCWTTTGFVVLADAVRWQQQ